MISNHLSPRLIRFYHPSYRRNPPSLSPSLELGGLYWSASLLINQAATFVAAYMYFRSASSHADTQDISSSVVWLVLSALEIFTLVCIAVFFWLMNPLHDKSSFYSTMTAKQHCCNRFVNISKTDLEKFVAFESHPSYYKAIRHDLTKWVNERWPAWKEDRPDFLSDRLILMIPDDMIPREEKNKMLGLT